MYASTILFKMGVPPPYPRRTNPHAREVLTLRALRSFLASRTRSREREGIVLFARFIKISLPTITLFGVKSCTFLYNSYRNMSELNLKSFVCIGFDMWGWVD